MSPIGLQTIKSQLVCGCSDTSIYSAIILFVICVGIAIICGRRARSIYVDIVRKIMQNEQTNNILIQRHNQICVEIEKIHRYRLEQSKIIDNIKQQTSKQFKLLGEMTIDTLHESLRSGNDDHTMNLISRGCPYNDKSILLLLQYGNYKLYKFWCEHNLIINHNIVYNSDNKFDKNMNIYHDIDWFNDVVTKLLNCERSHNYIMPFVIGCLHYCNDTLFSIVTDKYMNCEIFKSDHLHNDINGLVIYISLYVKEFMMICSNDFKFEYVTNNVIMIVNFDEMINDDDMIWRMINSNMQCVFGYKYMERITEWRERNITIISDLHGNYYTIPKFMQ